MGLKTDYIRNKSFDDEYFRNLIVEYIKKFGKAKRVEIDQLLHPFFVLDGSDHSAVCEQDAECAAGGGREGNEGDPE